MERRKFAIGMGALATGSSAAIGTGAFTTAEADRNVNVNVASDSSGFVELTAQNETYASGTDGGELVLNFNGDSGIGIFDGDGEGLNPNTEFNFENVFRVANIAGQGDMRVVIEANGFDLDTLELTGSGDEALDIAEGTSLRAKDYSDVDNLPKLVQPDAVDVDMTIETNGSTGSVGGTLVIHAATGGNRDQLSDVVSSGT